MDPTGSRSNKRETKRSNWSGAVIYLNNGTGNPCAGQSNVDELPAARMNEFTRSSLENFGPFAPIGSGNITIVQVCQLRRALVDDSQKRRGRLPLGSDVPPHSEIFVYSIGKMELLKRSIRRTSCYVTRVPERWYRVTLRLALHRESR